MDLKPDAKGDYFTLISEADEVSIVQSGFEKGMELALIEPIPVGKQAANDLIVMHTEISRHARSIHVNARQARRLGNMIKRASEKQSPDRRKKWIAVAGEIDYHLTIFEGLEIPVDISELNNIS